VFKKELESLDETKRARFLIEENVKAGVRTLRENAVVANAIAERGLHVHGVVYDVGTGVLEVVDGCAEGEEEKSGREGIFCLS
jgi:carbonic anhydrase